MHDLVVIGWNHFTAVETRGFESLTFAHRFDTLAQLTSQNHHPAIGAAQVLGRVNRHRALTDQCFVVAGLALLLLVAALRRRRQ